MNHFGTDVTFKSLEEEVQWFLKNEQKIKQSRKAVQKTADAVYAVSYMVDNDGRKIESSKAEGEMDDENNPQEEAKKIRVKVVINTTNLYDSHGDVHAKGIWNKSIREKKQLFLCYEHNLSYKGIMSDVVKAYTEEIKWSDLGFDYEGTTEALIFECEILKEDLEDIGLEFMYKRYKQGRVYNHSVRMQYVKEIYCWKNTYPDASDYNDNYEKYIKEVANREDAEKYGRFWYVTEAKIIEGSAVVRGSNFATPTQEVEDCYDTGKQEQEQKEETQAVDPTLDLNKNEPSNPDTQEQVKRRRS